jgi:hypothetical protein
MKILIDTLCSLAVRPGHLLLVAADDREKQKATELITAMLRRKSLYTIAAGDWLPGYGLARMLRSRKAWPAQEAACGRVARPFTCRQLAGLLAEAAPDGRPLLVLDLLNTFYDAGISLSVRADILTECCRHLQRLSRTNPVVVIVQQEAIDDYHYFYPFLAGIAHETLQPVCTARQVAQLALL